MGYNVNIFTEICVRHSEDTILYFRLLYLFTKLNINIPPSLAILNNRIEIKNVSFSVFHFLIANDKNNEMKKDEEFFILDHFNYFVTMKNIKI